MKIHEKDSDLVRCLNAGLFYCVAEIEDMAGDGDVEIFHRLRSERNEPALYLYLAQPEKVFWNLISENLKLALEVSSNEIKKSGLWSELFCTRTIALAPTILANRRKMSPFIYIEDDTFYEDSSIGKIIEYTPNEFINICNLLNPDVTPRLMELVEFYEFSRPVIHQVG